MHPIVKRRCTRDIIVYRYLGRVNGEDSWSDGESYKCFIVKKTGIRRNALSDDVAYSSICYIDGSYDEIGKMDEILIHGDRVRVKDIEVYRALDDTIELMEVYL